MLCAAFAAEGQTARVVLKWKATAGVKSYHVQIAREPTFSEVVLDQRVDEPVVKWEALPSTTFYWRVRSFDAEGRASEWSTPRQIAPATSAPLPQSPEEGASVGCTDAPQPLVLASSSVLKEYVLELSTDARFPPAETVTLKGPNNTFELPLLPGAYVWRGKGIDLTGKATETSAPRKLTVKLAAPKLKAATDVAAGTATVSLGWNKVPCAKRYLVEAWHETPDHAALEATEPAYSFKPTGVGEYRFRVAAKDDKGNQSEWSAEGSFRVRMPPPTQPRETVSAQQTPSGHEVEFSWTEAAGASSYVVEVSTNEAFTRPTEVTATEIIARLVLKPGRYVWRVTGRDEKGHPSFPSDARHFVVADSKLPPDPVTLTFPLADSILDRPADGQVGIAWTASATAVGYELEVDAVSRPVATPPIRVELPDGDHLLRVRAQAANGLFSAWSEARLFFFGAPRTKTVAVTFDPPLLRCDGQRTARVEVRLKDHRGRKVSNNPPELSVDTGVLSVAREEGDAWVAQWRSPPALPASPFGTLTIKDRDFASAQLLPLSDEFPTLTLGLTGGGRFNGGAVASPAGVLSVGWRLLTGRGRLTLQLRGSLYRAASTATGPDGPVPQEVLAPTVSLLGGIHLDFGPWSVRGLLGPAAQIAISSVAGGRQTTGVPSIELAAAGGRRLGPGAVELELSFLYGRLDTAFAKLQAGGLFLGIGYRLDLPGGF